MESTDQTYNMNQYIFEIKDNYLFVLDNPITNLSPMDFFDIKKIDSIYNLKSKSNDTDFAMAIIVNGQFYYRTVDKTEDNITLYKKLINDVVSIKSN